MPCTAHVIAPQRFNHRVIGSVSSHVRHNVSSTAAAQRNDVPARDLTALTALGVGLVTAMPYVPGVNAALDLVPLPGAFFGVLAAMMIGYLLLTSIAKALYVHAHGEPP